MLWSGESLLKVAQGEKCVNSLLGWSVSHRLSTSSSWLRLRKTRLDAGGIALCIFMRWESWFRWDQRAVPPPDKPCQEQSRVLGSGSPFPPALAIPGSFCSVPRVGVPGAGPGARATQGSAQGVSTGASRLPLSDLIPEKGSRGPV